MPVLLTFADVHGAVDQNAKQPDTDKAKADDPVYEPGDGVKAPKLTHYVEPDFAPASSKEAFVEGLVKISVVVTPEGVPTRLRVLTGLNEKEDAAALDAVKKWRFHAGTKDGHAVNVHVTVEVEFHLL